MGDYIEQALEEQRRKAERKAVAAAAQTSRSERRASGEGLLPPVNEQQPSLQREASMASEAASGSPMSVTMEPPVSDGSTRLPAAQAASVDRMASDYDSSDEEGAHKPPSPPPEPPPAQQPLPPPPMQLAAQAHCLAAKLPAVTTPVTGEQQSRTRPRTTRVSDAKSRGRRQSFIEFAEREKERREKQADRRQRQKDLRELETALAATLSSPGVSIYDLLMAEYALQPQNYASHGVMRAGYLKLLYVNEKDHNKQHGARIKGDIPSQLGVSDLRGVAEVFTLSSTLRETAWRLSTST
jgi:hypothetical protein